MSKGKYLYTERSEKYITTTDGKLIPVSGEMNPCLYKKGDFLATESGTYIATEHGQLILLREHPCPNPNFSIKCSQYFGDNLMVIKNASFHYQLSLTDEYLLDKENHATTDFIEVDPLKNYAFTSNASFFRIAFYDENKQFISSEVTEVVFNQRWIENLPTGTKYIRISAEYFTIQDWGLYELTNDRAFAITYFDKKVEVYLPDFYGVTRALVGTPDLFSLSYRSDSKDKGQTIMATEADINIYQDDYFNIDNLATSGETDIKIQYYESDLLVWSGFVLPDFFEVDIKPNPIISMVATDRLGVLKKIDFKGERRIPRDVVLDCLANTGLILALNIIFQNSYFETTPINLERYDGMSCYDVLTSVLTAFNAKVVQYGNKWNIVNKLTLETRPTSSIIQVGLVDVNGRREIKPTASEISLFLEFGGSKKYPNNWNFEKLNKTAKLFDSWSNHAGFEQGWRDKRILFYVYDSGYYNAWFTDEDTDKISLWYRFYWYNNKISDNILDYPNLRSEFVKVPTDTGIIEISLNGSFTTRDGNPVLIMPIIHNKTTGKYYTYNRDGEIASAGNGSLNFDLSKIDFIHNPRTSTEDGFNFGDLTHEAVNINWDIKNKFNVSDFGSDTDKLESQIIFIGGVYLQGALDLGIDIFINSVQISFNDSQVTGKGLIFKIKQGGEKFSKSRDPETIHFSDKINQGVNGHFYNYKYDDTSIVDLPSEFMLQNTLREQAQMFSKARDFLSLSGNIKVNPLARYICGNKQYVLVGGTSGRKNASVQLEEIVSENLTKIDYIYTYFD